MRLLWENIRKSLGIPDKQVDAEFGTELAPRTSHEETFADETERGFMSRDTPASMSGEAIETERRDRITIESEGMRSDEVTVEPEQRDRVAVDHRKTLGHDPTGGYQQGPDDGVYVAPTPITGNDEITVTYAGQLVHDGAQSVYLHMGTGPGDWVNVQDIPMDKVGEQFEARLEVADEGQLEFCFRDDGDNWDNNDGRNWSYIIHNGELRP